MLTIRLALEALVFSLIQNSHVVSAALLPRQSTNFAKPASSLLSLINGVDTTAAAAAAIPYTPPGAQYEITQASSHPVLRAADIATTRLTFVYGPPVAGGPYYPTGTTGLVRTAADLLAIQADELPQLAGATVDNTQATINQPEYDGLNTLDDYTKLYRSSFKNNLPRGPDPGAETNYTQDLFFSMERLSNSPYQVRRLNPSMHALPFQVDSQAVRETSGSTLQSLFHSGRLFYADYRDQQDLAKSSSRYAAACDAYFYIDKRSGDFLPLAVRTNAGSNLIYTPQDSANDWLLAKIMLNVNDFWFAQWNHLAQTHEVVQIAYMAAIRTLSVDHPVLAILDRLMFEVFGIQPLAEAVLFAPGTVADQMLPFTGQAAQDYTTNYYQNKGSGRFQSNYFQADLEARGLLNSNFGPKLKSFPFYEDAFYIWRAIGAFTTSFVRSYYKSDLAIKHDKELQAWVKEARGPAKAIDFPAISSIDDLIAVLTHFAHLSSTAHHAVNTNELLDISSTLPFHPPALYKPIPRSKGVRDVASYLPPFDKVLTQFTVAALFARPKFVGSKRTLIHMFDDKNMLDRMNNETKAAARRFKWTMRDFSSKVSVRIFDEHGLSQGMPFVWRALDPNVVPYSITT